MLDVYEQLEQAIITIDLVDTDSEMCEISFENHKFKSILSNMKGLKIDQLSQ